MCSSIPSCIIIIVNIAFMVVGLVIFSVGAILQWGGKFVSQRLDPMLEQMAGKAGSNETAVTINDFKDLMGEYTDVLGHAGIIFLIIGAILFGISFFGICGVCCESKILLFIYIVSVGIIFLVMFIILIVFLAKRPVLKSSGEHHFKEVIKNEYQNFYEQSGVSRIIDLIQVQLMCCGVNSYTDFYTATKWNRTYEYTTPTGTKETAQLVTPFSCCKMKGYTFQPIDQNCTVAPSSSNSNFQKPCYIKIWTVVNKYALYICYGLGCLCALLFILFILAVYLVKRYAKKDA